MLVNAWTLAQEHWLKNKAIPAKAWPKDLDVLIEVEFAHKLSKSGSDWVYVKGSKKQFGWLEARSEAGQKGGQAVTEKKAKAARKNGKLGGRKAEMETQQNFSEETQADDWVEPNSNILQENPSKTQANPSKPKPHSSLLLSHSSFLTSQNSDLVSTKPAQKGQLFVAAYCREFKRKYGFNPDITAQDAKNAKALVKEMAPEKIELYVQAYFQMPDSWLVKTKHPMNLFKLKLNEIAVFANTGNFTTQTQATQADAFATNAMLLNQVRSQP